MCINLKVSSPAGEVESGKNLGQTNQPDRVVVCGEKYCEGEAKVITLERALRSPSLTTTLIQEHGPPLASQTIAHVRDIDRQKITKSSCKQVLNNRLCYSNPANCWQS